MNKLTIEITGINSANTKIFVDNKQIGMIKEFELKANSSSGVLEMLAKFPDLLGFEIPENSAVNKIPEMIKLLESCNVKCQLIK